MVSITDIAFVQARLRCNPAYSSYLDRRHAEGGGEGQHVGGFSFSPSLPVSRVGRPSNPFDNSSALFHQGGTQKRATGDFMQPSGCAYLPVEGLKVEG